MSKIAIITDVNAGLDYIGYDPHIPVLRSIINFGDEHLVDGVDIKADEFYARLKKIDHDKNGQIPSTSAPTVGETMKLMDRLVAEGYTDAIMYAISYPLSSIGTMVETLIPEYEGRIAIHVVNTLTSAFMQGYMAVEAKGMADNGASVEEILARADYLTHHMTAYFVVDDLKYLVKNGRLSRMSGALGTLFQVKPILQIIPTGEIVAVDKCRTYAKACDRIVDNVLEFLAPAKKAKIFIFHAAREAEAQEVADKITAKRPEFNDIELHLFTPAVGAHIGYSIVGIGCYNMESK